MRKAFFRTFLILVFVVLQINFRACFLSRNLLESEYKDKSKENKDKVCKLLGKIKEGEVVTEEQRKSWYYNNQSLIKLRGEKNNLEAYMQGDKSKTTEIMISFAYAIGIFVIFFVFSIFGYICYWTYCLCECCLPPCKCCCKCCKRERVYTGIDLHWPILGNVIFLLSVIVICIYGLQFAAGFESSFNTFICTALTAFDGLTYGGGTFSGIFGIMSKLDDFSQEQLGLILTSTKDTFTGEPEWVSLEKDEMDYIAEQMKIVCSGGDCVECTGQTYQNIALKPDVVEVNCAAGTWNYVDSYNYAANGAYPEVESIFFANGDDGIWGIQVDGAKKLYTGTIKAITAAIQGIEEAAGAINEQTDTMGQTIQDGIDSMGTLEETMTKQMDTMIGFHDSYYTIIQLVSQAIYFKLAGFIVFAIAALVIIGFMFFKRLYRLRIFLHLCWITFSFTMIITFLLTIILMGLAVGGQQMCEIMLKMFNDPDQFDLYSSSLPADMVEKIKICKKELNPTTGPFKGDDNLAKAFGIDEQLSVISDLRVQIGSFDEEAGPDSDNMVTLRTIPGELDIIIANLEGLLDKFEFEDTRDHVSLDNMLTTIKTEMDACTFTNDIYVTDTDDCGVNANTDFTTAATTNTASEYCFWVDDAIEYSTGGGSRYNGCASLESNILITQQWRYEKDNMASLKKVQTENLKAGLEMYIALHTTYVEGVKGFNDVVLDALEAIDGNDGIINSIKCFWFGSQIDNLYDAICVSFINSSYNLGFVYAIFSIGLFFSSLFLVIFSLRMGFNQKTYKKIKQYNEKDIDNNNMSKTAIGTAAGFTALNDNDGESKRELNEIQSDEMNLQKKPTQTRNKRSQNKQ